MNVALYFLYSFLQDGLPFSVTLTPLYLFLRFIFLFCRKQKNFSDKINIYREYIMFCLFIFIVHLFVQTFVVNSGIKDINIIPFNIIIKEIIEFNKDITSFKTFILNIIGNVVIFVPVGIFAAYLWNFSLKRTAVFGFLISLTIESTQLLLPRTSDVDDLMLNTFGTVIGYFIYKFIKNHFVKTQNKAETQSSL